MAKTNMNEVVAKFEAVLKNGRASTLTGGVAPMVVAYAEERGYMVEAKISRGGWEMKLIGQKEE